MIALTRATFRSTLAGIAVIGTIAWAASFVLCDGAGGLTPLAAALGIAAGAAWVIFGLLLRTTVAPRHFDDWIDLCLKTQTVGIAVLMSAAAANVIFFATADWLGSKPIFPIFVVIHAGLLLLADIVMGTYFVANAPADTGRARALAAWVLGLNGIFAVVLALLLQWRIFQ